MRERTNCGEKVSRVDETWSEEKLTSKSKMVRKLSTAHQWA